MSSPAAPSEPPAVVVLGYHVDDAPPSSPPRRWPRVLLLVGTVPLLVVPFVAFTYGVSPLYAVTEVAGMVMEGSRNQILLLGLLAGPFFLAVPIFLWQARLLAAPRSTPAERGTAYALAGTSTLLTVGYFCGVASMGLYGNSRFGWDAMVVAAAAGTAAAAAAVPWWARRFVRRPEARVAIALNLAYLANAGMCLYGFADDPDVGWWLTLAGGAALLAELALITADARRSSRSAGTPPGSHPASSG